MDKPELPSFLVAGSTQLYWLFFLIGELVNETVSFRYLFTLGICRLRSRLTF